MRKIPSTLHTSHATITASGIGGGEATTTLFTPAIFAHTRRLFTTFLAERGNDPKAEFFIPAVVNLLIEQRQARLKVLSSSDSWFGITYKDDRPTVAASISELVARGVYPERLWT